MCEYEEEVKRPTLVSSDSIWYPGVSSVHSSVCVFGHGSLLVIHLSIVVESGIKEKKHISLLSTQLPQGTARWDIFGW